MKRKFQATNPKRKLISGEDVKKSIPIRRTIKTKIILEKGSASIIRRERRNSSESRTA